MLEINWETYDLKACLKYNPQDGWEIDDVADILAVVEGENDEGHWHWLLRLKEPPLRYVYLVGGCDYTGWDCQSWAESSIFPADTEVE